MNIVAQNIERDKAHQKGMSAEEFEQFTTYFYKLNDVSRVVPALSYFFKNEQLPHAIENGRNGPLTYFFYRLAQLHPDLWDQYAQLFDQAGHDQRLILIWIFSLEKGDTVDRQLISWRNDDKLREEHEEINEMLQTDDRGINILDIEHATSAADLDRLWTEFIVTGNIAAIRKIIEVVGWADITRFKLEQWLKELPENDPDQQKHAKELSTRLQNIDIWIDVDRKTIISGQDLDCYCVLEGCNFNPTRFESIQSALPFIYSAEDLVYLNTKSSAKWSLCANAQMHQPVLDTCKEESETRTEGCRISLLEIITYAYLNSLEHAMNYFYQSFTTNGVERDRLRQESDEIFFALMNLQIDSSTNTFDDIQKTEADIDKCIANSEGVKTYISKLFFKYPTLAPADNSELSWRMEYTSPDRMRVFRIAGDDADEWISIKGFHYRGPMFMTSADQSQWEGDTWFNEVLTVNNYFEIMRREKPHTVYLQEDRSNKYFILEYINFDPSLLKITAYGDANPYRIQIWIDFTSLLIAKVEISIGSKNDSSASEEGKIVHLFSEYDEDISVIPPPFQIMQPSDGNTRPINVEEINMEIEPLARIRSKIRAATIIFGAMIGAGLAIYSLFFNPGNNNLTITFTIGVIVMTSFFMGLIGYIVAEIIRWFIPSQWRLSKLENSLKM